MKFSVKERIILLQGLPKEGNIITVKALNNFKNELAFDDNEIDKIELKIENGVTVWKDSEYMEKDIEIGTTIRNTVKEMLEKLDSESKLTVDYISLWEKFCE